MADTLKWPGIGASSGRAIGRTWILKPAGPAASQSAGAPLDARGEVARLTRAISATGEHLQHLEAKVRSAGNEDSAQIFAAHLMILNDPAFAGEACDRLGRTPGLSAEQAISQVAEAAMATFNQLDDEYFRERATDIKDILQQVLAALANRGQSAGGDGFPPAGRYIVVADELTPAQTVNLPLERVLGFIVHKGGKTSHAAILARTYGIPAVITAQPSWEDLKAIALARIDGDEGVVEVLTPAQFADLIAVDDTDTGDTASAAVPAAFAGLVLAANIGGPADLPFMQKFQAQGVGLYRTEFLFMGDRLPTEDEQTEAYRAVIAACRPNLCVIRTLDIGGDKQAPALNLPREQNPFLGLRAIRLCLQQPAIFLTQLRALWRASAAGPTAVMFPMIATVEELLQAKQYLMQAREAVLGDGYQPGNLEVGMMIEVPAAALIARRLAREVDFFSLGTNDLTQYTLAVDRENNAVASLGQPYHPAVLGLVAQVVAAAKESGIWVGVCGEAGGDALLTPFFAGLAVDELSMAPGQLPKIRQKLAAIAPLQERLGSLVSKVLACSTADEVTAILRSLE